MSHSYCHIWFKNWYMSRIYCYTHPIKVLTCKDASLMINKRQSAKYWTLFSSAICWQLERWNSHVVFMWVQIWKVHVWVTCWLRYQPHVWVLCWYGEMKFICGSHVDGDMKFHVDGEMKFTCRFCIDFHYIYVM